MTPQWEYRVEDDLFGSIPAQLAETLNEWGEEGWELVSVTTFRSERGAEHMRYFFRRPKEAGQT